MDTYEPFLGWIISRLKRRMPTAKLLLQETWAYEIDSTHDRFVRYERRQDIMYRRLRNCYMQKAHQYKIPLIPCGDVIQELRKLPPFDVAHGGISLCQDGFHMSYDYGRYAVACTWLAVMFDVETLNALGEYNAVDWCGSELAQADGTIIVEMHKTIRAVCRSKISVRLVSSFDLLSYIWRNPKIYARGGCTTPRFFCAPYLCYRALRSKFLDVAAKSPALSY